MSSPFHRRTYHLTQNDSQDASAEQRYAPEHTFYTGIFKYYFCYGFFCLFLLDQIKLL